MQKALIGVEKHLENAISKWTSVNSSVEKDTLMKERDQLRVLYDNFRGHYDSIKAEVVTY